MAKCNQLTSLAFKGLNQKSTTRELNGRLCWMFASVGNNKRRRRQQTSVEDKSDETCLANGREHLGPPKLSLICVANKRSSGVRVRRTSIQLATPASALFWHLLSLFAVRPSLGHIPEGRATRRCYWRRCGRPPYPANVASHYLFTSPNDAENSTHGIRQT